MEGSIILLSGPVGAGKSTVAGHLVAALPGPVAYIEGDKFWCFIAKGHKNISRLTNFKIIMRSMAVAALPYARSGYRVVLDFSVPPWYLNVICKIAAFRHIPLNYVVLRPDEAVCAARAANRTEGTITDYGPYKELYACFDEARRYTIYDNQSDAAVIAAHVIEGLDEGLFRVPG